jgi:hypothetical protein
MTQMIAQDCMELSKKVGLRSLELPCWMLGQVVAFYAVIMVKAAHSHFVHFLRRT